VIFIAINVVGDKLLLGFPLSEVTEAYLMSHASHPTVPRRQAGRNVSFPSNDITCASNLRLYITPVRCLITMHVCGIINYLADVDWTARRADVSSRDERNAVCGMLCGMRS